MAYKETVKNLPFAGKKLVGAYSWYLRLRDNKFLKKNLELKNKFSGKRCFILATGPSLKTQDLKRLEGELSVSVSNFFVHPDFKIIRPAYHIFAPSHEPITERQYAELFADAEKHFPERQNVFLSVTDRHIAEKYGRFKKQNVYYYSLGNKPLKKEVDFAKDIPSIQTSPQIAMYLSLYLGATAIYLLGCDHDWILHLKETRHFYDERKSVMSQAGYNEWSESDLGVECAAYASLWEKYRKIRKYAEARGVVIVNATAGGLLDLFPRKKLEDILTSPQ